MTTIKLPLPPQVINIIHQLERAGHEVYVVGGAVHELLMHRPVDDWDFTTSATPQKILKVFPDGFYNNKFGTVGLGNDLTPDNPFDITTFRKEVGYSDRRHPDKIIWGKTLQDDLARRDFTVNAMALKLKAKNYQLIDPYHGQDDLKARLIRAVGHPADRFNEDALRLMRTVRIATELGFTIEDQTFQAIRQHSRLINQIAAERIKAELFKILSSDHPADGIIILKNAGLLSHILPELEAAFGVEQKSPGRHHIYDVGTHSIRSLKFCPSKDPLIRFATLIHDLGKVKTQNITPAGVITFYNHEVASAQIARSIANRLRFSKKEAAKLVTLVRYHQFTVDERQTDSAIRRFIKNVGKANLKDMLDLRTGDRLGGGARETSWRLEKFKARLKQVQKQPFAVHDLKVTGHDVMSLMKLLPGPQVGQILNQLFAEAAEDKTKNTRKYLLPRLKQLAKQK